MGRGAVVKLKHVHIFRDRTGRRRAYLRIPGRQAVPLPGMPGSPEFMVAYNAGIAGFQIDKPKSAGAPGSVHATIAAYYTDTSFLSLAPTTRAMRRAILERFRAAHGDLRLAGMEQKHVALILGKLKPFAARNWLKTLRGLMGFAIAIGLRPDDPTDRLKLAKAKHGGHHTWTEDEIAIFERHHAISSRAYRAMAILLYTAARRGDAVLLGHQHLRSGRLVYRQQKTGRLLTIPVHLKLAEAISETPRGQLTFLVTAHGKPFTPAGFGNWFRECCNAAGLPHCSAHGLRKAQARRLAEAGCSAHEIAAITGHKTLSEVQRYTAAADQQRLAEAAIRRTK